MKNRTYIVGSQFQNDKAKKGGEYAFRILTEIMQCMEKGVPLILN